MLNKNFWYNLIYPAIICVSIIILLCFILEFNYHLGYINGKLESINMNIENYINDTKKETNHDK